MKYVFDRQKFSKAIEPHSVMEVLYDIRLTPSQMQTFFKTEPCVERLRKLVFLFPNVNFLDLTVVAVDKAPVDSNPGGEIV